MSETAQRTRHEIRSAIETDGFSCAEFGDLALEDFDLDEEVDVTALNETWAAAQSL